MGNWNGLSLREKADLIREYVNGGVLDLDTMRRHYNSFDEGGKKGTHVPSQAIKDYIKKTESFKSGWYLDGNGVPTVGYGFTGKYFKDKYLDGITREQADKEFDRILGNFADMVKTYTPNYDSLNQNQKDALLSYMYNVGPGNYTKKSPKFQQALKDKDWEAVARNMDIGYNDKRNPGLRKRRDYERNMFLSGISQASGPDNNGGKFVNYYEMFRDMSPHPLPKAPTMVPDGAGIAGDGHVSMSSSLPDFSLVNHAYIPTLGRRGGRALADNAVNVEVPSTQYILEDLWKRLSEDNDSVTL